MVKRHGVKLVETFALLDSPARGVARCAPDLVGEMLEVKILFVAERAREIAQGLEDGGCECFGVLCLARLRAVQG